jgi:hypothetical protein
MTGNGHARRLGAEVKTLPTPRTSDGNGSGVHGEGGADLRTALKSLPTPTVNDSRGGRNRTAARSCPESAHHDVVTLVDAVSLLPTPTARDWKGENRRGDDLPGAVRGVTTPPPSDATSLPPEDPRLFP